MAGSIDHLWPEADAARVEELESQRDAQEVLTTYGLRPMQQFDYTVGKNATDIALIVDAMDFLYTAEMDGICIVSSDSDYTPLATRIREKGLFVMGIGRMQTPRAFISSCDLFVYTENLTSSTGEEVEGSIPVAEDPAASTIPAGVEDVTAPAPIEDLSRRAYDATSQDDVGWANLGTFGHALRQLDSAFDSRTYGHKSLSQLVQSRPDFFETEKRESTGGNAVFYIRLKGN